VCANCGKAFARTDALNRHLKVENGCATALNQRQFSPQYTDDQYFPQEEQQMHHHHHQQQQQQQHQLDPPQFFFETL
jgi:hypothetical protein